MQIYIAKKILDFFDYFYQKRIINELLKNLGKRLNLVFDVGAHKGESIINFNKYFVVNKILSFEPSKKNFRSLEKIAKKFPNVEIFNFACGCKNEKSILNFSLESSSSTLNKVNENSKYFKLKKKLFYGLNKKKLFTEEQIQIRKLDNFLTENKITDIDLLKIDTEGYEFEVIKGLSSQIQNIRVIYFEHHYDDMVKKNYTFTEINDYLKKRNFIQKFKLKMPFRKTFEYIYLNAKK